MNRWPSITYFKLTEALMARRLASSSCDSKDSGKEKSCKQKEKEQQQESSKNKKENSKKKNICGRDVLSTAPRCKDGKFPGGGQADKGSKKKPVEKDQKKNGSSKSGGWFGKK
ncbi:uncharacterized protein LOC111519763 [Drosophila willistoni]|uniref:uncharacterized protein LOC111519763 n=1 Tax=Drosophila willistoni TaxID=7260 RepID=UPI001F0869C0|nr:uncharacterized protein LOC111519763 [Drosophila willistoni]